MVNSFIDPAIPVLVQGATGRSGRSQTAQMVAYGTNIVAGVSRRDDPEAKLPLFRTCAEAVKASNARASVAFVPPLDVLPAILEAIDAGIELIVTVAEGVPVHDALKAKAATREAGVRWVGASTPGLAIPGKLKMGFLPKASRRYCEKAWVACRSVDSKCESRAFLKIGRPGRIPSKCVLFDGDSNFCSAPG